MGPGLIDGAFPPKAKLSPAVPAPPAPNTPVFIELTAVQFVPSQLSVFAVTSPAGGLYPPKAKAADVVPVIVGDLLA